MSRRKKAEFTYDESGVFKSTGPYEPRMFTSSVPAPHPLEMEGNLAQNWKKWRQVWNAYETVTNNKSRGSEFRVATFITCIGPAALDTHEGLPFKDDDERNDIDTVLKLWDEHCVGKVNVIYERYKFNGRDQKEHETIEQYITALR